MEVVKTGGSFEKFVDKKESNNVAQCGPWNILVCLKITLN